MITVPELAADALGGFIAAYMERRFGSSEGRLVELVPSIARIALECMNRQLGYESPADLVHKYPQFYWNCIAP
jgi:hypothetical protein